MMIIVVAINTLLSLVLFYVAWRVWKLKRKLKNITNTLIAAERSTHAVLYRAPNAIYVGQQSINNLRLRNQGLESQIQQIRQIFSLIAFGQQVWRRHFFRFRSRISSSSK
jgi:hypothetical protein